MTTKTFNVITYKVTYNLISFTVLNLPEGPEPFSVQCGVDIHSWQNRLKKYIKTFVFSLVVGLYL